MMINALPMGGAEMIFVRLAVGLKQRGHEIVVHLPTRGGDGTLLSALHESGIPIFAPWWHAPWIYRWVYKLSKVIEGAIGDISLVDILRSRHLRRLHRRYRFDVVNAHLTYSERAACLAFADVPLQLVGCDHGDYRLDFTPQQVQRMKPIFARSDVLVCPSLDNLSVASRYPWSARCHLQVIYHGYDMDVLHAKTKPRDGPLVFGMVSRGISEKGWLEAVTAFRLVRDRFGERVQLVLVGAGEAIDAISASLDPVTRAAIKFTGYQADPQEFVRGFDVAMLPTHHPTESLPCVIIEYLAQGKPVLATQIGGIPEMLRVENATAGVLIPLDSNRKASVPHLVTAMIRLVEDPVFLEECRRLALKASTRFNMQVCLDCYEAVFRGEAIDLLMQQKFEE